MFNKKAQGKIKKKKKIGEDFKTSLVLKKFQNRFQDFEVSSTLAYDKNYSKTT